IRDSASALLEDLGGAIESGRAAANPAPTPKPRAASRSGGTVDAPGKAHRKPAPTARATRHSDDTVAKIKGAKTMRRGRRRGSLWSALDRVALPSQHVAHAIAQVAVQLDPAIDDGAAGAAAALQLLRQLFQERVVARQAVDHGHDLPAASLLLHAQLRDDTRGECLVGLPAAALAVGLRPAAPRTHAALAGRIHGARGHGFIIRCGDGIAVRTSTLNCDSTVALRAELARTARYSETPYACPAAGLASDEPNPDCR